jgi:hypothetical protein
MGNGKSVAVEDAHQVAGQLELAIEHLSERRSCRVPRPSGGGLSSQSRGGVDDLDTAFGNLLTLHPSRLVDHA